MPLARIGRALQAHPTHLSPRAGGWTWLRSVGQRCCLALMVLCLPLQGMATAIGHIDGLAHVHRAPRAHAGPARAEAPTLPPGMPMLLSVDEFRHSHGAPRHTVSSPAEAAAHHHEEMGRHVHAADDASVVAVDDPADEASVQAAGKRILIDVDTPPAALPAMACGDAPRRPPINTAAGGPDPGPDRLERPPRLRA